MKKHELEKKLKERNINPYFYCLDGGLPNEAYTLGKNGDLWEVYYSERGNKSKLKTFLTEDEACDYLYEWIIRTVESMQI